MLIFVEEVNERLIYTFDFIFKERDLSYVFTSSETEFEKTTFKTRIARLSGQIAKIKIGL